MTTIIQAPLAGASHLPSKTLYSDSYPDLQSLDESLSLVDAEQQRTQYEYARTFAGSAPSTAPSSPQLTYSTSSRRDSYSSTPGSSLFFDQREMMDDDDDMAFPSFDAPSFSQEPERMPQPIAIQEEALQQPPAPLIDDKSEFPKSTQDDQVIESEPTRHVDYLSHEWREEDIWHSWSYVVHRRGSLANGTRLENASWRSWMKAKNNLKTVSPETLNWLKDCDVTWLYGPLQTNTKDGYSTSNTSPPPSRISHSSSFISKKPILKKKSASAAILERSRSQHSLLQRASDIIRVQQSSSPAHGRPTLRRGNSEFLPPRYPSSSVVNTPAENDNPGFTGARSSFAFPEVPTPSDCKHVLFNEEVRQVQAIDSEEDDKAEEDDTVIYEDDEDDDCGLMMAPARPGRGSGKGTPRNSFSAESKTIVPLPSTTLKYRTDTPEPPELGNGQMGLWPKGRKLSPSPSQETLRPPRPSQNFLIDDDPEVIDEPWQTTSIPQRAPYEDEDYGLDHSNLRRTESGMFMPYDEDEEEAIMNNTLFGQAMYAVNTFRDIAHVVWNVGWNRR